MKECIDCGFILTAYRNKEGYSSKVYPKRCILCRIKKTKNSINNLKCSKCNIYKQKYKSFYFNRKKRFRSKVCRDCVGDYQRLYRQKYETKL